MPLGPQPKRARGTVGHPYSALNLRFGLALFGLISCATLAGVAVWLDHPVLAVVLVVFAGVAVLDLVVIQLRRRAGRRAGGPA
jgi:hypothetical protein